MRYKHGTIPVIGLTGGIGGGKSEVAAILAGHGSAVIDADLIGHQLLDDSRVRAAIVARFGDQVLARSDVEPGAAPRVDRRALGAIVFADDEALEALEAILHPLMRAEFLSAIDREMRAGPSRARSIVLDAAILQEAGWDELCDLVVFVDAPREIRMQRAFRQRGWSEETLERREQAQWPCDEKRRRADFVIVNDADVERLHQELKRLDDLLERSPCPSAHVGADRARPDPAQSSFTIPERMVVENPSPQG
jgi:dephospho-CoA kinase